MPTVEVRCENLTMEAKVTVGSRALPTVLNSYRNFFEVGLRNVGQQFSASAGTSELCMRSHDIVHTRQQLSTRASCVCVLPTACYLRLLYPSSFAKTIDTKILEIFPVTQANHFLLLRSSLSVLA